MKKLLEQHSEYIAKAKARGAKVLSYNAPCCNERFDEGCEAAAKYLDDGKNKPENPYRKGTADHAAWERGWDTVCLEDIESDVEGVEMTQRILSQIDAYFGDTSRPHEDTKEGLKEIMEHVELLLETLND
jgi:hypothetical protein